MAACQCSPQPGIGADVLVCFQVAQQNHDQDHHSNTSAPPSNHGHCSHLRWPSWRGSHSHSVSFTCSTGVLDVVRHGNLQCTQLFNASCFPSKKEKRPTHKLECTVECGYEFLVSSPVVALHLIHQYLQQHEASWNRLPCSNLL